MAKGKNSTVAIYLKMVNQMGPAVRNAEAQLGGFRRRVHQDFTRWGAALALVVASALTASANVGSEFEQSLANVGAVARATSGEMAALEEKARSLGASTAFTAGEAAEAMYSLASGGLDVNQTIAASEPVLKLAGATMSGMAEAAEITMSSMAQFGLEATDSERIVNVFAAGIQNSTLNMQRLSDSMTYAGPVAASVGMNLEQTTAALGLLHNAGLKGSIAGTGLAMSLQKIIAPGKDLQAVLGSVSLEGDGFEAVIRKIEDANLSAGEMTKMFGPRAFKAIKALTTAGADGFAEMTEKLTGTNAVFEMYDRQMATTSSKFKMMKSAIQENLISVFFQIKPALDVAIDSITEFVKNSKSQLIGMADKLVAVMGSAWSAIQAVFGFLKDNIELIKRVATTVGTVVAAFYALSVAVGIVNAVMTLGTFGLVAIGITAAATAITVMTGKTVDFGKVWQWITHIAKNIGAFFKAGLSIAGAYWDAFFGAVSEGAFSLVLQWEEVGKLIIEITKAYVFTMFDVYKGLFSSIKDLALGIVDVFKDIASLMKAAFTGHLDQIPELAKKTWSNLKENGLEVADHFKDVGKGRWEKVGEAWGEVSMNHFTKTWENNMSEAHATMTKVLGELPPLPEQTKSATTGKATEPGQFVTTKALEKGQAMYTKMVTQYQSYADRIKEIAHSIPFVGKGGSGDVSDESSKAMDLIKNSAGSAMSGMVDSVAGAVLESKNLLQSLGNVGKSIFGSLLRGFAMMGLKTVFPVLAALPGFAMGGDYPAGTLSVVGERGPELFYSGSSGTIIPNHKIQSTSQAPTNSGDTNINVTLQVGESSLLLADNDPMIRRFGEKIAKVTEEKISRTYRPRRTA